MDISPIASFLCFLSANTPNFAASGISFWTYRDSVLIYNTMGSSDDNAVVMAGVVLYLRQAGLEVTGFSRCSCGKSIAIIVKSGSVKKVKYTMLSALGSPPKDEFDIPTLDCRFAPQPTPEEHLKAVTELQKNYTMDCRSLIQDGNQRTAIHGEK